MLRLYIYGHQRQRQGACGRAPDRAGFARLREVVRSMFNACSYVLAHALGNTRPTECHFCKDRRSCKKNTSLKFLRLVSESSIVVIPLYVVRGDGVRTSLRDPTFLARQQVDPCFVMIGPVAFVFCLL